MFDSNHKNIGAGNKAGISEIKRRADIREVWSALGGGKLRGGRGQAFWRNGDGYNVALDPRRGTWYDFVAGEGGDAIALIETVQQCGFKEAIAWLADHVGLPQQTTKAGDRAIYTEWLTDLRWATWWRIAAEALAELTFEGLPFNDPARRGLTELLRVIRLGDASLVDEYREWRRQCPAWTAALAHMGRRSDARRQVLLAYWIRRTYGPAAT
jgi:hypothetical protein